MAHSHLLRFSGVLIIFGVLITVQGQPQKCNQRPIEALKPPSYEPNPPFHLHLKIKGEDRRFLPDQTYVLELEAKNASRPFKEFMITVEDPDLDSSPSQYYHRGVDVGKLKTLDDDIKSKYSERCSSTVENKDMSDKTRVEMHWVSPKQTLSDQRVRFRAMVAENKEMWHVGGNLEVTVEKNSASPLDSPPYRPNATCNLCSEARYQVIFKGQWSRGTHSLHYPKKPDENSYSQMVGASHDYHYEMWKPGTDATLALQLLAEKANISGLERDIIQNMNEHTRTLIRGKMHKHPRMSEPSHSLFRVDRVYHLFSLVVALRPSPDWFLGTSQFELCTSEGWLKRHEMPLYPWDAGTRDGVSYDSETSETRPQEDVHRVAVGSFDKASPFYQLNLNDLKPFATLVVEKLDEYPTTDCNEEPELEKQNQEEGEESKSEEEEQSNDGPLVAEWRVEVKCPEPGEWSTCVPDEGDCGLGVRFRPIHRRTNIYQNYERPVATCLEELEEQPCFINCY